ncbi:MAG: hypothetical protein DWI24_06770 [Planctomycetota bacterium]|nr:MAG: hypothetical protein DWI24_06770 [Planctomycetota bacterium]
MLVEKCSGKRAIAWNAVLTDSNENGRFHSPGCLNFLAHWLMVHYEKCKTADSGSWRHQSQTFPSIDSE